MTSKNMAIERISFLIKKFNILEDFEAKEIVLKLKKESEDEKILGNKFSNYTNKTITKVITYENGSVLAIYDTESINMSKTNDVVIKNIRIHEDTLSDMIIHDPTSKKIYVQWLLTTMTNLIKHGFFNEAVRFAEEDLPQATEYLELFHKHKLTRMFKKLCKNNHYFDKIDDPSDINQYTNISQIFNAVDPYIEKNVSELETKMLRYVKLGEAEITFKDKKWTVYVPLSLNSSVIFGKFVSWCTAKEKNSNFDSYRNDLTPDNKKSKLFIIINNNFFLGQSDPKYTNELYQAHFESGQVMDKNNSQENNFYDKVLAKSNGLTEYFHELLVNLAKKDMNSISDNKYFIYLSKFGFSDDLFNIINPELPTIKLKGIDIKEIPPMGRFKALKTLYLNSCGLMELNETISELKSIVIISLPNNNLLYIPDTIGKLKNLKSLNLTNNKLKNLPDSIAELDPSNGGGLMLLVITDNKFSDREIIKIKKCLPNVNVITSKEDSIGVI